MPELSPVQELAEAKEIENAPTDYKNLTPLGLARFIRQLGYIKLSKPDEQMVEMIDEILNVPFDGDFTRINGEMRWRISLADRIKIREQLLSAIQPVFEERRRKGEDKLIKASKQFVTTLSEGVLEEIRYTWGGTNYQIVLKERQALIEVLKGSNNGH